MISNNISSNKRSRDLNDAPEPIYQKLRKTDYTNVGVTRTLLLGANSVDLVGALHCASEEDHTLLHSINTFANNHLNLANRGERLLNRVINKYPDCFTVDSFLNEVNFKTMQKYIDKCPKEDLKKKEVIFNSKAIVSLEAAGDLRFIKAEVKYICPEDDGTEVGEENEPWIAHVFASAMRASYKLEGDKALGTFKAHLYIVRDTHSETNETPKVLNSMHHDTSYTKNDLPKKVADYLCLLMLSDSQGKNGWQGGDLMIQKDHFSKLPRSLSMVKNYDFSKKHVQYSYPINNAICINNKENVHQRTELKGEAIQRDLLNIQLFRMK